MEGLVGGETGADVTTSDVLVTEAKVVFFTLLLLIGRLTFLGNEKTSWEMMYIDPRRKKIGSIIQRLQKAAILC